jgi:hypothetical protein
MATVAIDTRTGGASAAAMRYAVIALVLTVWVSAAIFGAYILAFYGGALQDGALERWNKNLPELYEATSPVGAAVIGAHFAAGAILLVLGPVQLIGAIRRRAPRLHHWLGRIYVTAAFAAGVGGLSYIAVKGTIGGPAMNIGFAGYGALMVLASAQTLRHAMARRLEVHRAWAIRLFALAIGSWLYRIDYGFWALIADSAGHTRTFDGWFDVIMDFFFYVPTLIVAELCIRARPGGAAAPARIAGTAAVLAATALVVLGTYFFTRYEWGPQILARFA